MLTINKRTLRRFILGTQGLFPGAHWQGKEGVRQALQAGAVVQVDPLNVVARSHDIVLYGRVRDYHPSQLDTLLYNERALFDYGGTVMIHPMEELPYWRVVMARKQQEPRRVAFADVHQPTIDAVLAEIKQRGALSARDFGGARIKEGSFRSGKLSGQALYYLWLAGELMTHSRRGFERVYDLRARIAPPHLQHAATADEADDFFARKVLQEVGLTTAKSWHSWFAGAVERKVAPDEAAARMESLITAGDITAVMVEGDPKTPRYLRTADLPLLEALHAGKIPNAWQPIGATTEDEMLFLAPLEIVSTRGRALPLFGFEYLWEVYKPQEKRRWGYYTLPILYGDALVARLDPKLERTSNRLDIKGFWLESGVTLDARFTAALAQGFRRFMAFVGATHINLTAVTPPQLRAALEAHGL
ncbi:MAG: crosslink repair DNA glycosylase YcaQ family protein [Anaerolineae bacterium]